MGWMTVLRIFPDWMSRWERNLFTYRLVTLKRSLFLVSASSLYSSQRLRCWSDICLQMWSAEKGLFQFQIALSRVLFFVRLSLFYPPKTRQNLHDGVTICLWSGSQCATSNFRAKNYWSCMKNALWLLISGHMMIDVSEPGDDREDFRVPSSRLCWPITFASHVLSINGKIRDLSTNWMNMNWSWTTNKLLVIHEHWQLAITIAKMWNVLSIWNSLNWNGSFTHHWDVKYRWYCVTDFDAVSQILHMMWITLD